MSEMVLERIEFSFEEDRKGRGFEKITSSIRFEFSKDATRDELAEMVIGGFKKFEAILDSKLLHLAFLEKKPSITETNYGKSAILTYSGRRGGLLSGASYYIKLSYFVRIQEMAGQIIYSSPELSLYLAAPRGENFPLCKSLIEISRVKLLEEAKSSYLRMRKLMEFSGGITPENLLEAK